jgi:hypothetical protein
LQEYESDDDDDASHESDASSTSSHNQAAADDDAGHESDAPSSIIHYTEAHIPFIWVDEGRAKKRRSSKVQTVTLMYHCWLLDHGNDYVMDGGHPKVVSADYGVDDEQDTEIGALATTTQCHQHAS